MMLSCRTLDDLSKQIHQLEVEQANQLLQVWKKSLIVLVGMTII